MNPEKLAADSLKKGLQWMQNKAKEHLCVVAGSLMVEDRGQYFNRLFYVFPHGNYLFYDKKHLFSMGNEQSHYHSGENSIIVEIKGWKIKPLTCYDVRFPTWCRNTEDYDLLTFHASFPEKRIAHWDILLQARALENLSYVAAVNRIGNDGNGIAHNGSSQVIAPDGNVLVSNKGEDTILYASLSKEVLEDTRHRFPFLQDRD